MLLHLVSLEHEDPISEYHKVRNELTKFDVALQEKEEWIIFTKKDLVNQAKIDAVLESIDITKNRVFVTTEYDDETIKVLQDALVKHLKEEKKDQESLDIRTNQ